jgi:peptidyl-prolyl cis-trans isomerase SurA
MKRLVEIIREANRVKSHVMNKTLIGLLAALALAPGAIAQSPAQSPQGESSQALEQVVVKVNDDAITSYDLRQRARLILASAQIAQTTQEILQAVQAQALRALIDERIQLQQAKRYELEVPEEEVQAELDALAASQNISTADLLGQLQGAGIDPMTLRDQLAAQWVWSVIVRNKFAAERVVSDSEIDESMRQMVENAAKPQFQLAEILVEIPEGATDQQAQQLIAGIYQQLQAGAPFPAVARQISAAPSAPQGGDMGWVSAGSLDPAVEAIVNGLQPGQVSPPIDTQDGIYIVALRAREAGKDVYNLTLKQLLVPVAGRDNVEQAYRRGDDLIQRIAERRPPCTDLDEAARRISRDIMVTDLGLVRASDLGEEYASLVRATRTGTISAPIRSGSGTVALMVCDRSVAEGADLPSRDLIERQISSEKLQRAARRHLRDLRRAATIEPDIRL